MKISVPDESPNTQSYFWGLYHSLIKDLFLNTAPCPSTSPLRVSSSSHGQPNSFLRYSSNNYTVILDENETSTNLHITLTVKPNTPLHVLEWTHNGYIVNPAEQHPRIEVSSNGSLTVNDVRPSDAGRYVVFVSSNLGCDSVAFNVKVQC